MEYIIHTILYITYILFILLYKNMKVLLCVCIYSFFTNSYSSKKMYYRARFRIVPVSIYSKKGTRKKSEKQVLRVLVLTTSICPSIK